MTSFLSALVRRFGLRPLVTASVVGLATLFVVWNLSPWLWFVDSTPTGGDMGAHVYPDRVCYRRDCRNRVPPNRAARNRDLDTRWL